MQLTTAEGFPVECHRRCCVIHGLLSARKRQLTYSFYYAVVLYCHNSTFHLVKNIFEKTFFFVYSYLFGMNLIARMNVISPDIPVFLNR